ncbi:adenylate/guanylate cyclase domain-containing protein [Roseibium sp. RKSG952]|uniref:adenylate/guanylate cyclase domain-containing protein n=1 Tax=Roseibium sp. RKSG952 TaxID=2529384 RepID=UPI0012BC048A|nr:adenylate/guanylate cyclase domain-containing protein [Roseibium sp. RKSG952]MTH99267.1 adenylate/guanylate cyclase domain-containing protein [Roseibium sp. RKSG952]
MVNMQEIDELEDWLIGEALSSRPIPEMFAEMCERLRHCQVPVERALLGWATLHPLIEAEIAFWTATDGLEHEQFAHEDEDTDDWLNSPMRAVLINQEKRLRRRLDKSNSGYDFELCQQLADEGYTDYLVLATAFRMPSIDEQRDDTGILVSWATRQTGGFTDDQLYAIEYIQKRLALSARANVEEGITRTIAETYLGKWAGNRVLNGQIRHGDGELIRAVIVYCDMRQSTSIAEVLGPERYLSWLNTFFQATAAPVLENDGEVLDFIGDAVLGIFPIRENGYAEAVRKAILAADAMRDRIEAVNRSSNNGLQLKAGTALSVGEVMFGNIGVAERLTFSVIGQTVHAAARLEALTKTIGCDTLMTSEIAELIPDRSRPVGDFELSGFSGKTAVYALLPQPGAQ